MISAGSSSPSSRRLSRWSASARRPNGSARILTFSSSSASAAAISAPAPRSSWSRARITICAARTPRSSSPETISPPAPGRSSACCWRARISPSISSPSPLPVLYEPYGFAISYGSARGHFYDVTDITETGRPHALANCWTCKTPDFTNMVNEEGIEAYTRDWTEVQAQITEGISCYNCHANTPGVITVTHTYWIDALGDDFEKVDAANMACGQCHNEY
ncbi:MAG: ammonia-forming cytochrome c nitrite reductase subunit c552, partial [Bacteroidales bacterium]|nr:ammonia-forming cytochrome c nitrite reductase subunit c552 [Bacteroidales bacterium]